MLSTRFRGASPLQTWSPSAAAIGGDAQGSAGHGLQFERVDQELLMKPLVTPTGASLGEIDVPTAGMTSSVVVVVSSLVAGRGVVSVLYVAIL